MTIGSVDAHAPTPASTQPQEGQSLEATLASMKAAQRKSGAPSYEDRLRSLERLERALLTRKGAIAEAISRDFGNRSRHESMVSEIFLVIGAIKHARATCATGWSRRSARRASCSAGED